MDRAHEYEHLMMVYYDVMLVDDDVVMNSPHWARRRRLQELVSCGRGLAIVSKQKNVDFSSSGGPDRLRTLFATAITHRWEGLVIKPSDEPYFSARQTSSNGPLRGWIKLKKDYIPGLGDSADFAVVGAGYDASQAAKLKNPQWKWTHFHLGCLGNKKEVKEKNARPYIMIVGALDVNADMTKHLNQHGQFCALPFGSLQSRQDPFEIDIENGFPSMNVIFRKPFVLDVVGAGFDKEGNQRHYTLRFPRALRIHSDRDWRDSVSFDELQSMAKLSRTVPADTKTEVSRWEQQLEQVDRGTKGSHVPWDLSDDDIDALAEALAAPSTGPSTSRFSRRRSSVAAPMIRMDTQEMNEREERLDSGEVVERPSQRSHISNWSDSNLPTPPPSSLAQPVTPVQRRQALGAIQGSSQSSTPYSRQALSSCQSTVSTDRSRKRSTTDDEETPRAIASTRRCLSPPIQQSKTNVCNNANNCQKANIDPLPTIHKAEKTSTAENFLVPKLSIGAAEALRSKRQPRIIKDMERTSPDRQTTEDETSTQDTHSTQQSLMDDWHLQDAEPQTMPRVKVPDLRQSHIVLSADVSGMPYLTEDLLTRSGLDFQTARQVFPTATAPANIQPMSSRCKNDRAAAEQQEIVMFVEGRRHDSTLEMMKFLVGRIATDASQIVWVFDWRLAEDVCARKIKDHNTLLDRRLLARFWYGADDGELRWLSERGDIFIVPRENIEESRGMDTGRLVKLGAVGAGV